MNIHDYIECYTIDYKKSQNSFVNKHVTFLNTNDGFPSKLNYTAAILGLPDYENPLSFEGANQIRNSLFELAPFSKNINLIDLGNIKPGHTFNDTCFALSDIISFINQYHLILILLGGSAKHHIGSFLSFKKMNAPLNMVTIDSTIEREKIPIIAIPNIEVTNDHSLIFNYTNIGYQSHFVEKPLLDFIDDSGYEAYRLGYVKTSLKEIEPLIRDANLINLSLNSIKHSDAPGGTFVSPNGFSGDEACQLAFYAGHSNRIKLFGVSDFNPERDIHSITAKLSSQLIWYFIEGLTNAIYEEPDANPGNFTKFLIHLDQSNQNIAFYKSNLTNRWWMEITFPDKNHNILLSCSESDYELACKQDIPERWWKLFQRISL